MPAPAPGTGVVQPMAVGKSPITYTTPQGWVDQSQPGGFRVASFATGEGDNVAAVSVIPLGGTGGSPLSNVNRWRQQVGLADIDQATFEKESKAVDVGGAKGYYVHLAGPQHAILAASVPHAGATWFIKMTGPTPTVEAQKQAFDALLGSIRFVDNP
jgi:hypothetical protein